MQVLFAFLLVLPFQSRFDRLSSVGRGAYGATLMASAIATALLIAPAAVHRLNFRGHNKEWILHTAHRCVLVGMGILAAAMVGAVFVVASAIYGSSWAAVPAVALGAAVAWLWFILPLSGPRPLEHPERDAKY